MTQPSHPFLLPLSAAMEEPADLKWGRLTTTQGAKVRFAFSPLPDGKTPKGHIVMLPGFKEPIEKYFEAMRDLHARGYAVWMMDWRGQGGSDRYLSTHPHKAHHNGYEEQIETLHQFITQHVLPGKPADMPLHMIGHSMGGHLALRYLHDHNQTDDQGNKGPIVSALLTAPMLDISTGAVPKPLARQMVKFAKASGALDKFIPGGAGWRLADPSLGEHAPNAKGKKIQIPSSLDLNPLTSNLTSDLNRIGVIAVWFTRLPELAVGDPTYGWLYHTLNSIDLLNQESYLKAIKTPILMQISGEDRVVMKIASLRAAGLMPNCTRIDIDEARHEIWMERDVLRQRWLAAMDDFLTTGPGAAPTVKKTKAQRKTKGPRR